MPETMGKRSFGFDVLRERVYSLDGVKPHFGLQQAIDCDDVVRQIAPRAHSEFVPIGNRHRSRQGFKRRYGSRYHTECANTAITLHLTLS